MENIETTRAYGLLVGRALPPQGFTDALADTVIEHQRSLRKKRFLMRMEKRASRHSTNHRELYSDAYLSTVYVDAEKFIGEEAARLIIQHRIGTVVIADNSKLVDFALLTGNISSEEKFVYIPRLLYDGLEFASISRLIDEHGNILFDSEDCFKKIKNGKVAEYRYAGRELPQCFWDKLYYASNIERDLGHEYRELLPANISVATMSTQLFASSKNIKLIADAMEACEYYAGYMPFTWLDVKEEQASDDVRRAVSVHNALSLVLLAAKKQYKGKIATLLPTDGRLLTMEKTRRLGAHMGLSALFDQYMDGNISEDELHDMAKGDA